ncbi:MAG: ABC transporter permease [Chloroflexi bacterium]|nr:ABC transporter permease [Chloroflexota bacterium]
MAVEIERAQPTLVSRTIALSLTERRETSLWQDAGRRLIKNKAAVLGLAIICLLLVVTLFAPSLAPYGYATQDLERVTAGPSAVHLLGTDQLGRDVLSRLIYGARISITVGLIAQIILLLIGVPLGALAGYFGGWLDTLIMRVVDILFAFPDLLFVILIMSYLRGVLAKIQEGPLLILVNLDAMSGGLIGVFAALGLTNWLTVARLVRGQILSLREKEYVEAAHSVGATDWRILRAHLLPNALAPIIIAATFGIPQAIMLEAGLSFLGLGVRPPMPSWGIMIAEGVGTLQAYPHLLTFPALALALTLLSFNFLGDGLRDALDPWMK